MALLGAPPPRCGRLAALPLVLLVSSAARRCLAAENGSGKGRETEKYALVADAGSTGTRVYLFRLAGSGARVEVTDCGKGPALSSFQDTPEKAAAAVAPQLAKAKGLVPERYHANTPVSVFATAGMRLISPSVQDTIYGGLRAGILDFEGGFPFDASRLDVRTISGREEGIFALLAANYLSKHLRTTLRAATGSLMGVLDLGGSSTQVAAPPSLSQGEHIAGKLGVEHTFVRSFLNLGMERMRQRTYQRFIDRASEVARARKSVPNPCSFYGYTEQGEQWRGTGESEACEAAVVQVLQEERAQCAAKSPDVANDCLSSKPVPVPQGGEEGSAKFFLISGYMYVTDFAGWLLKQPNVVPEGFKRPEGDRPLAMPTIKELREAAALLCSESWERLSLPALDPAKKHRFTSAKKVPHRCFEINYIVALLSTGYGFKADERLFHIVDDIEGGEIEWTLGAFLHGLDAAARGARAAYEL